MDNKDRLKKFLREAEFIAGANNIKSLPKDLTLPEIAFVGKSNVGKSTLINTLCNRKKLVKTSKSPGHTKQINFFKIDNTFTLVDLPGYGFSRVSHSRKEEWKKLISYYFAKSKNIILCNILLDARRDLQENDLMVMEMMENLSIKWQVVITKSDKLKTSERSKLETLITDLYDRGCTQIFYSGYDNPNQLDGLRLALIDEITLCKA
ncbi:MAG: ribosome biogenesis GTP-binding protein YihA/YsxC [Rickettsiaceae bacterium]|nr:ribosome biogenesis GTP-binding protein YihA/YsxC [Rickettsiaceae bacterium]